mmetsp:Transcript_6389/g.13797  ORF Transcript_6389/g.13797 Transcript_6389/m.13797 type:complete len:152 (+) Transcript_6389:46-501(+)
MAAPSLSEEDLQEFREIFNLVDTDRGGSISVDELGSLMDTLGIRTTPEELKLMVQEIDSNGNGEIDFEEFVQVMSRKVNADYTADEVKKAFRVFAGPEKEGCIKVGDLERALQVYGREKLTEEEAKNLVSQIDAQDGIFNYAEYVNMMMAK